MALDTFNPYLFVSSGEQSNKFLTPAYADGIAQFQAQRAQDLTGLTVRIDPIQEGTGEPSPTNIRPISGRTGMTVTRAGKNLLPFPYSNNSKTINGVTFTVNSDGSITVTGTPTDTASFIVLTQVSNVPDLNGKTVTISGCPSGGSISTYYFSGYRLSNGGETSVSDTGNSKTFVWSTGTYTNYNIAINIKAGTVIPSNGLTFYPQIELGSTATPYAPYQGTTYPISWQTEAGTVYGGTLDVVSGVLTVDRAMAAFDGSNDEKWEYYSITTGNMFRTLLADRAEQTIQNFPEKYACNSYHVAVNAGGGRINGTFSGSAKYVDFVDDRYSTVADWRAALAQTPIQFVYPLATPQTYQLTPTEVRTIAGFNQIYSDAGPVIDIKF